MYVSLCFKCLVCLWKSRGLYCDLLLETCFILHLAIFHILDTSNTRGSAICYSLFSISCTETWTYCRTFLYSWPHTAQARLYLTFYGLCLILWYTYIAHCIIPLFSFFFLNFIMYDLVTIVTGEEYISLVVIFLMLVLKSKTLGWILGSTIYCVNLDKF